MKTMEKKQKPYSEAVSTGQYVKKSGLGGKYDNVRRFWEDEATRLFIRGYLKETVDRKARMLERLRILDLGCGAGDGYDLLMGITAKDVGIFEYAVSLIDPEVLGLYMGIDINGDLLDQAREIYSNEKAVFKKADVSNGLGLEEEPFDMYFTSFGTLSHFSREQTVRLLADVASHARDGAIVICDWLGRYSYEWQDLWLGGAEGDAVIDYRISYIYPPEERDRVEIQSFPLRMLYRDEVVEMVEEAAARSGIQIRIKNIFDRSIFVGRHMDTAEYNRHCPAIREAVNSLLEPNVRTDLNTLIVDYVPRQGFAKLNKFFEGFSICWNTLLKQTLEFLAGYSEEAEGGKRDFMEDLYTFYPGPLKKAVKTMKTVIDATGNLPGDSRANIIEPQLAYALRRLEMDMQPGWGVGHGLVGVLEIDK
jgi:SAM-dependent methyltransferase